MRESQASICNWSFEQFGQPGSDAVVAIRANEEWVEFLRSYAAGKPDVVELADTAIVLFKLATNWSIQVDRVKTTQDLRGLSIGEKVVRATRHMSNLVVGSLDDRPQRATLVSIFELLHAIGLELCRDLDTLIDEKMVINRGRTWKVGTDGIGYHVRAEGTLLAHPTPVHGRLELVRYE